MKSPLHRLRDGARLFRTFVFPQRRRLFEELAGGQKPPYLFITCSDSRVDPVEMTQTGPGDLFIERSIGNLVPRDGCGEHEALAAVEYAVIALGVEHIIICGHSQCGAVKALLDPESTRGMPNVAAWLANAEETRAAVARKHAHLHGDALLSAAIRENVVVQLEHLRALSCVAERLTKGLLHVHGWVYEFERGEVFEFDPRTEEFVSVLRSTGSSHRGPGRHGTIS